MVLSRSHCACWLSIACYFLVLSFVAPLLFLLFLLLRSLRLFLLATDCLARRRLGFTLCVLDLLCTRSLHKQIHPSLSFISISRSGIIYIMGLLIQTRVRTHRYPWELYFFRSKLSRIWCFVLWLLNEAREVSDSVQIFPKWACDNCYFKIKLIPLSTAVFS